jgi:hypothetical protein
MSHERIIIVEEILMIIAVNSTIDISVYMYVYVFDDPCCLNVWVIN